MDGRRKQILEPAQTSPWQCLEAGTAFDDGGFQVRLDIVLRPDGSPGTYTYLQTPGDFAVIVALDSAGRVAMVRQWRYPWNSLSWELPAGHLEPGESGLQAAQRELAEEAGLRATSWHPLGVLRTSASLTARSHVFLARELTATGVSREASEGDMVLRRLPLEAAVAAAAAGDIVHAISISALFLAHHRLGSQS